MLSVLIPTYNYSILELLNALQEQITRLDKTVYVIICDDASTDLEIANQNKLKASQLGFTYLENTANLGRTATRDILANKATTQWLLFLDADVLPKNNLFIANYLAAIDNQYTVIFGGISYGDRPKKEELLRWVYGNKRETKTVAARNKTPYFIISQNLCVTKATFLSCNTQKQNGYGLDNLFSNNLKQSQARILHIDNPVVHLGLESSEVFIAKSMEGITTTVRLEEQGLMEPNLRPIQRVYLKLKRFGLLGVFSAFISLFNGLMQRNIRSANPNLLFLDLLRLQHLIQLKKT